MSERSRPGSPGKPTVIYVMGAHRSGSTILGVAMGNCAGVFYAGELDKWLVRSGVPQVGGSERNRFWSIVREEVHGAAELFGEEAHSCLDRSSALFRIRQWPARRRLRQRYRRVAEDLYRGIARARGVTHIVDTSHYPLRARELQELDGIDLYLIFLVRDARSVVASFDRRDVAEPRFGAAAANAYLWLTHLLSVFVFLRHPRDRRLLLRHEDFLVDPEGILRDVLDRVGSPAATPNLTSLRTGIPFQANRLIRSDVIALRGDASRPPGRAHVTTLLQLPWKAIFSRLQPAAIAR
jgi:hypothetical protein